MQNSNFIFVKYFLTIDFYFRTESSLLRHVGIRQIDKLSVSFYGNQVSFFQKMGIVLHRHSIHEHTFLSDQLLSASSGKTEHLTDDTVYPFRWDMDGFLMEMRSERAVLRKDFLCLDGRVSDFLDFLFHKRGNLSIQKDIPVQTIGENITKLIPLISKFHQSTKIIPMGQTIREFLVFRKDVEAGNRIPFFFQGKEVFFLHIIWKKEYHLSIAFLITAIKTESATAKRLKGRIDMFFPQKREEFILFRKGKEIRMG